MATLIARGLGNPEIAETLVLSPHTVQDHVKSLFEKLGVASRQELVARVFLDEYLPEVEQRTPLTSHGRFDREPRNVGRTPAPARMGAPLRRPLVRMDDRRERGVMTPALVPSHDCDDHARRAVADVWSVFDCVLRPPAVLAGGRKTNADADG